MGFPIFLDDIYNALTALHQANRRAMEQAEIDGMNVDAARRYSSVYTGALDDVAASFGLSLSEPVRDTLKIPTRIREPADDALEVPAQAEQALPSSAWRE